MDRRRLPPAARSPPADALKFVRHLAAVLLVVTAISTAAVLRVGSTTAGPAHGNRVIFDRQLPNGTIVGPDGQPIPITDLKALRVPGPDGPSGFRLDVGNLANTTVIDLLIAAVVVAGSATRHTIRRRSRRRNLRNTRNTAPAA